jgi:hypothetical protein
MNNYKHTHKPTNIIHSQQDFSSRTRRGYERNSKPINPTQLETQIKATTYKPCTNCDAQGLTQPNTAYALPPAICPVCSGNTHLGVSPHETNAYPGTPSKVAVLAARYQQGLPLWNEHDINVKQPQSIRELLQLS